MGAYLRQLREQKQVLFSYYRDEEAAWVEHIKRVRDYHKLVLSITYGRAHNVLKREQEDKRYHLRERLRKIREFNDYARKQMDKAIKEALMLERLGGIT